VTATLRILLPDTVERLDRSPPGSLACLGPIPWATALPTERGRDGTVEQGVPGLRATRTSAVRNDGDGSRGLPWVRAGSVDRIGGRCGHRRLRDGVGCVGRTHEQDSPRAALT